MSGAGGDDVNLDNLEERRRLGVRDSCSGDCGSSSSVDTSRERIEDAEELDGDDEGGLDDCDLVIRLFGIGVVG